MTFRESTLRRSLTFPPIRPPPAGAQGGNDSHYPHEPIAFSRHHGSHRVGSPVPLPSMPDQDTQKSGRVGRPTPYNASGRLAPVRRSTYEPKYSPARNVAHLPASDFERTDYGHDELRGYESPMRGRSRDPSPVTSARGRYPYSSMGGYHTPPYASYDRSPSPPTYRREFPPPPSPPLSYRSGSRSPSPRGDHFIRSGNFRDEQEHGSEYRSSVPYERTDSPPARRHSEWRHHKPASETHFERRHYSPSPLSSPPASRQSSPNRSCMDPRIGRRLSSGSNRSRSRSPPRGRRQRSAYAGSDCGSVTSKGTPDLRVIGRRLSRGRGSKKGFVDELDFIGERKHSSRIEDKSEPTVVLVVVLSSPGTSLVDTFKGLVTRG